MTTTLMMIGLSILLHFAVVDKKGRGKIQVCANWMIDQIELQIQSKEYVGRKNNIPKAAIEIIKQFEGYVGRAEPDPLSGDIPYTNGWGATTKQDGTPWKLGEEITEEQAYKLLIHQLENDYLPKLQKIPGWKKFNSNQRAAILSFSYNVGGSFYKHRNFKTITHVLEYGEYSRLPEVLAMYRNPGSDCEAGLLRRRRAEAKLFFTPIKTLLTIDKIKLK